MTDQPWWKDPSLRRALNEPRDLTSLSRPGEQPIGGVAAYRICEANLQFWRVTAPTTSAYPGWALKWWGYLGLLLAFVSLSSIPGASGRLEPLLGVAIGITLAATALRSPDTTAQSRGIPSRTTAPVEYERWVQARRLEELALAVRRLESLCSPIEPDFGYLHSASEAKLATALARVGIAVHPQQREPRGALGSSWKQPYCADLAYYDAESRLRVDIEVDGEFKNGDAEMQQKLQRRDEWFTSHGWYVLRFHSQDCFYRANECAVTIQRFIIEMTRVHQRSLSLWGPSS